MNNDEYIKQQDAINEYAEFKILENLNDARKKEYAHLELMIPESKEKAVKELERQKKEFFENGGAIQELSTKDNTGLTLDPSLLSKAVKNKNKERIQKESKATLKKDNRASADYR